ncbi:universal stress protein [Bacillus solimangrovi]|uniref:Universal stress protein n=1 Tax=Bacillus solimangrovi TaxID=1305675 RepID=A0A1E5LFU6_9BACI|nr:universal stress protein [Bacillus solimangrovi]OEH92944.1 universal stress protein [Bacillus solimangrovi]
MFKKILLATDGSSHAIKAAEKAVGIAQQNDDATVEIIYVVDATTVKNEVLHHWDALDIHESRKNKFMQTEEMFEEAGISYKLRREYGDAGDKIVRIANDEGFDLVVVGSRGLNALQEMVLGSVSHKIAQRVESPVLIVK